MDHIVDYSEYISINHTQVIRDMARVDEGYGVPYILKPISSELFDKIENGIKNNIYSFKISVDESYTTRGDNYNEPITFDFKADIIINVTNENRIDIRATSKYVPFTINLKFNTESYNKLELKRVVLHELLHVYEVYFRMKNNEKSLQWSINSILYDEKFDIYKRDRFIDDLCYHIYLSFNHEIGARVCETYIVLMDIMSDNKGILEGIKNTSAWIYKDYLKNWNIKYKIDYELLLEFLIKLNNVILKKFKLNNRIFRIPKDYKDCDKILKEWQVIFKKKSKYFEDKLLKVIDDVIIDVRLINNTIVKENNREFIKIKPKDFIRQSRINKLFRDRVNSLF